MPTKTFLNLSAEKQHKLYDAMYNEFSTYTLADSKISNIVALAHISRGSFYTYFDDIEDAYRWVLNDVIADIHQNIDKKDILSSTESFILKAKTSPHFNFLSHYYIVNEALLQKETVKKAQHDFGLLDNNATADDISQWLLIQSVHQLIRTFFLTPDKQIPIITTLHTLKNWKTVG
ncbi:TetR/AcrR family transcriptional regulator [Leuconostoc inhae]|uniref:TetR/AcrR family transcriptional regulator n=1 Tax=Leuconostoc inhae TaxID=178001 RepID=UPI001C7CD2E9|nr:TetR/AcrR family transcriptional regulator [Leuconostoc inhae]